MDIKLITTKFLWVFIITCLHLAYFTKKGRKKYIKIWGCLLGPWRFYIYGILSNLKCEAVFTEFREIDSSLLFLMSIYRTKSYWPQFFFRFLAKWRKFSNQIFFQKWKSYTSFFFPAEAEWWPLGHHEAELSLNEVTFKSNLNIAEGVYSIPWVFEKLNFTS